MASLAQQESQSLSQNVKLGLQFRYQSGQVQVNHNHFLGYTKDAGGNLIIDPEQAEVVKRIFREYLEGYSMDRIAKGLEADGILTGADKTKWWTSTINKILRNEKYIGDALLQKTYTTDFLNKSQEQRHCSAILCGRQSRSNYSKGYFLTGAGRAGTQASGQNQCQWQKALLQLQPLLCADCHLRRIAHINELQDFIKQHPAHLEAFDKTLVKRWLERIIVWEDHFTVELKSELKIDIEG